MLFFLIIMFDKIKGPNNPPIQTQPIDRATLFLVKKRTNSDPWPLN